MHALGIVNFLSQPGHSLFNC